MRSLRQEPRVIAVLRLPVDEETRDSVLYNLSRTHGVLDTLEKDGWLVVYPELPAKKRLRRLVLGHDHDSKHA